MLIQYIVKQEVPIEAIWLRRTQGGAAYGDPLSHREVELTASLNSRTLTFPISEVVFRRSDVRNCQTYLSSREAVSLLCPFSQHQRMRSEWLKSIQ